MLLEREVNVQLRVEKEHLLQRLAALESVSGGSR
jgi:BMFP domain-containing protein YqiC